ncbi:MAG: hypothetical protein AABZ77_07835, partial [Chloroflexota bacterium]
WVNGELVKDQASAGGSNRIPVEILITEGDLGQEIIYSEWTFGDQTATGWGGINAELENHIRFIAKEPDALRDPNPTGEDVTLVSGVTALVLDDPQFSPESAGEVMIISWQDLPNQLINLNIPNAVFSVEDGIRKARFAANSVTYPLIIPVTIDGKPGSFPEDTVLVEATHEYASAWCNATVSLGSYIDLDVLGHGPSGTWVPLNSNDDNENGVPDYLDFPVKGKKKSGAPDEKYVPMRIRFPMDLDLSEIDMSLKVEGAIIRIWQKDGDISRTEKDLVQAGVFTDVAKLITGDREIVWYIEGIGTGGSVITVGYGTKGGVSYRWQKAVGIEVKEPVVVIKPEYKCLVASSGGDAVFTLAEESFIPRGFIWNVGELPQGGTYTENYSTVTVHAVSCPTGWVALVSAATVGWT